MDLIDEIIAYEQGTLGLEDTLRLFGRLIASGQVWHLQGSYGRAARAFIDLGFIDEQGTVNEPMLEKAIGYLPY